MPYWSREPAIRFMPPSQAQITAISAKPDGSKAICVQGRDLCDARVCLHTIELIR
jgi:hypothetical protein